MSGPLERVRAAFFEANPGVRLRPSDAANWHRYRDFTAGWRAGVEAAKAIVDRGGCYGWAQDLPYADEINANVSAICNEIDGLLPRPEGE